MALVAVIRKISKDEVPTYSKGFAPERAVAESSSFRTGWDWTWAEGFGRRRLTWRQAARG